MTGDVLAILENYGLEGLNLYYSSYRGSVVDNDDPENRNRLKVKIPQVYGEEVFPEWVPCKGIYSGRGHGAIFLPKKNEPVWIEFEQGNPRYPIWSYGPHMKEGGPEGASPSVKVLETDEGIRIEVNDSDKHVRVAIPGGKVIEVSENKVSLGSASGSAEPAVLGDKAQAKFEETLDELNQLVSDLTTFATTQQAATGTVPLLSPLAAGYATLIAKLASLSVKLGTLKATYSTIKSNIVTLD